MDDRIRLVGCIGSYRNNKSVWSPTFGIEVVEKKLIYTFVAESFAIRSIAGKISRDEKEVFW